MKLPVVSHGANVWRRFSDRNWSIYLLDRKISILPEQLSAVVCLYGADTVRVGRKRKGESFVCFIICFYRWAYTRRSFCRIFVTRFCDISNVNKASNFIFPRLIECKVDCTFSSLPEHSGDMRKYKL